MKNDIPVGFDEPCSLSLYLVSLGRYVAVDYVAQKAYSNLLLRELQRGGQGLRRPNQTRGVGFLWALGAVGLQGAWGQPHVSISRLPSTGAKRTLNSDPGGLRAWFKPSGYAFQGAPSSAYMQAGAACGKEGMSEP